MAKYFTLHELTRSSTATKMGISNIPTSNALNQLNLLMDTILDPIREKWGKPIIVTSGYRSPELNKAINGSATSQHVLGQAADIDTPSRIENKRLFDMIKEMISDGKISVGQLIYEYGDDTGPDWVHVSLGNKNQILRIR